VTSLVPEVWYLLPSCFVFLTKPPSTSAAPEITNQEPQQASRDGKDENGFRNEDANGIQHCKFAAYGIEAIKTTDGRRKGEQIILRHLKDVFVRMILRSCPSPKSHPPQIKAISHSRMFEYDRQIQPGIFHWRPDPAAAWAMHRISPAGDRVSLSHLY
jgi:hypothetical protein